MVYFIPFIQDYLSRLTRPKEKDYIPHFVYRSYARWAVYELMAYVLDRWNDGVSVETSIPEFIEKMNKYSLSDKPGSYMFSVAYDVACSIGDEFVMRYF